MQSWRTLAEVAKELGVTDRTLQRRLAEAGIRPARPGRTPMLSDSDVTKLMEESPPAQWIAETSTGAAITGQGDPPARRGHPRTADRDPDSG